MSKLVEDVQVRDSSTIPSNEAEESDDKEQVASREEITLADASNKRI